MMTQIYIKLSKIRYFLCFFFLNYSCLAITNNNFHTIQPIDCNINNNIGIVSVFPSPLGIFYNNRIYTNHNPIYPCKNLKIVRNINLDLSNHIKKTLQPKFHDTNFIALPSLSPEQHLTAYLIEGIWGADTKSVTLKNLNNLFSQYKLSEIVAIVPVTYYSPSGKGEASGINLSIVNNKIIFSSTYAILRFSKTSEHSYKKSFSSLKQVLEFSEIAPTAVVNCDNCYDIKILNIFYELFDQKFLPHIANQIEALLQNKNIKNIFPKPKAPLYYLLPH